MRNSTNNRYAFSGRDAVIGAVLITLVLSALLPVIVGSKTLFLRDVANFHWPAKLEQARALQAGELPFVDRWRGGGQPGLGNLNTLALYPSTALVTLMPTVQAKLWAFNAHFWLHLALAPFAFVLLARELGLRREGAWFGAALVVTSGFAVSLLGFYNLVAGLLLIPLLTVGALRLGTPQSRRSSAALVAMSWVLLLLAGDPTTALIGAGAAVSAVLARRLSSARSEFEGVLRHSLLLAAALACGTLIAWPQLQEFRLILQESVRTTLGYSAGGVLRGSVPPAMASDLLLPLSLGAPNTLFWASRLHGGAQPLFYSLSFGALGLALFLGVLLNVRRASGFAVRLGLAWIAIGGVVALGAHNPVIAALSEWRLLGSLRFPVKAWWLVVFGVGLVGGWALDRTRSCSEQGSESTWNKTFQRVGLGLLLAYSAFLLAVLSGLFLPWYEALIGNMTNVQQAAMAAAEGLPRLLLGAMVGIVVGLVLIVISVRDRWAGRGWMILLVIHAVSQMALLSPLYPTLPANEFLATPSVAEGLEPKTQVVHGSVGGGFTGRARAQDAGETGLGSIQMMAQKAAYPSAGVGAGLRYQLNRSPEGLDSFRTGIFSQVMRSVDDGQRVRLLEALGVTALIVERPVAVEGLELEVNDPAVAMRYRVSGARPLLAAAQWVIAETPQQAFEAMLRPSFDPTAAVTVDPFEPPEGWALREEASAGTDFATTGDSQSADQGESGSDLQAIQPARVEVLVDSMHRLELRVLSPVPIVLATDRAYLPRYAATVDGEDVETVAANVLRLALPVPAGEHTVVFEFDRGSWHRSLLVSLLGLMCLVGLMLRLKGAGPPTA